MMLTNNIEINLAGDVMIGRSVNDVISRNDNAYVWGDVLPFFEKTDINIINLETALTNSEIKRPKVFNFKAAPDKTKTLVRAKITVVNLANNHILDFSEEGLQETLSVLKKANIGYVGAGLNSEEAEKEVVIEKNNLRIGILGFTDNEPGWKSGISKPGTNYIDVSSATERKKMVEKIKSLKKKKIDLIIISAHWGYNMVEEPPQNFIEFAHEMIHAGADVIHGHSAHIFQGIELFNNKIILYDTGDFIDDYVIDPVLRNDLSFLFNISAGKDGIKSLKLFPVRITNYRVNFAKGNDYEWCIKRMKKLSGKFGTHIKANGEVIMK